jgi:hypothetical protein
VLVSAHSQSNDGRGAQTRPFVQVCRLPLLCLRLVTDTRCEVLHFYQELGRLEEAKSQFLQVQPQVFGARAWP